MNDFLKARKREYKGLYNSEQLLIWKEARWGILTFCFVHFVFEIATGNESTFAILIFVNYLISSSFVKNKIRAGKFINQTFLKALMVSCVVFLVRLSIGMIYTYLMLNQ